MRKNRVRVLGEILTDDIVAGFRWKDRENNFYYIHEMITRHLFYTVRMVWNHSAPEHMKLTPYHKYKFSKFYSQRYMRTAVQCMIGELKKRKDIRAIWRSDISRMLSTADRYLNYDETLSLAERRQKDEVYLI